MSPRPKLSRKVLHPPGFRGFKPFGCPDVKGSEVKLLLEEYEAINLADYQNLTQAEAAGEMGISRPTFSRIYDSARKKIARAFLEVSPIIIEGGNIQTEEDWLHCLECHTIFKVIISTDKEQHCPVCQSEKTEKINTPELPEIRKNEGVGSDLCICPKCTFSQTHIPGEPCRSKYCPNCGVSMIRENSAHHQQLKRKLKNTQKLK